MAQDSRIVPQARGARAEQPYEYGNSAILVRQSRLSFELLCKTERQRQGPAATEAIARTSSSHTPIRWARFIAFNIDPDVLVFMLISVQQRPQILPLKREAGRSATHGMSFIFSVVLAVCC